MKFEISSELRFQFELTNEQVDLLTLASERHYDRVCQSASQIGGFIYGWRNAQEFSKHSPDRPCIHRASWRQLDTCLKILENRVIASSAEMEKLRLPLFTSIHSAMSLAVARSQEWKTEINV